MGSADTSSYVKYCFKADAFKPDDKPLLSKAAWQKMQLGLNDLVALYPSIQANDGAMKFFPAGTLHLLQELHDQAAAFRDKVLPQARTVAGTLYDYANSANSHFSALANALEHISSADSQLEVIKGLLGSLEATPEKAKPQVDALVKELSDFNQYLGTAVPELTTAIKEVKLKIQGNQGDITIQRKDIDSQATIIKAAQSAILSDKHTIKTSLKYIWVMPIGTIVALAKDITAEKDISAQAEIIAQASEKIGQDMEKISQDVLTIVQLDYAEASFKQALADIDEVRDSVGKMTGAWTLIQADLNGVLTNLTKKTAAEAVKDPCTEAANLSTAAKEWDDMANETQDFLLTFAMSAA